MNPINDLSPQPLWKFFYEITQIPRPSKQEEKICGYLIDFARQHSLEYKQDRAGNVLIIKKPHPDCTGRQTIILQSHVDMVCEKNCNTDHDFDKDPLDVLIEDGWVKAKDTTLGADDGIGVAAAMAILADPDLNLPAIEALFTVDEETGLTGAFNLDENFISGKYLINLDSEDEGEIFIGCAGGIDTLIEFDPRLQKVQDGFYHCNLIIEGLKGGHSGDDIDKGLANAIKLLSQSLYRLTDKMDVKISAIKGGNLRNAIPREARASISVPFDKKEALVIEVNGLSAEFQNEYSNTEPNLSIRAEISEPPTSWLMDEDAEKLVWALMACKNGVQRMSDSIPGLVETSTNLASIKQKDNAIFITTSQRSSVETSRYALADSIEATFKLIGAKTSTSDGYPGWNPNVNSRLLTQAKESYKTLFNVEPKVRAIHAGLECGLFLQKYPGLDMVSIGPTIKGAHSPDERLSISSSQNFMKFLTHILENFKAD